MGRPGWYVGWGIIPPGNGYQRGRVGLMGESKMEDKRGPSRTSIPPSSSAGVSDPLPLFLLESPPGLNPASREQLYNADDEPDEKGGEASAEKLLSSDDKGPGSERGDVGGTVLLAAGDEGTGKRRVGLHPSSPQGSLQPSTSSHHVAMFLSTTDLI